MEVRLGERRNTTTGTVELVSWWGTRRIGVNDCDMRPSLRSCTTRFRLVRSSGGPRFRLIGSRGSSVKRHR